MRNSRRDFLHAAGLGWLGLPTIGHSFYNNARAEEQKIVKQPAGKAKSVIQIWMWGGPSHLETFDPKPDAGKDYCGPWNSPLQTNANDMFISQSLPNLARCGDLYSIVRSVTHGTNHHETATYMMQTGRMPGGNLVYPGIGAVVAKVKGYDAGYDLTIPPYVVLTTALGRFSESGFLGPKYKPFVTGGDPNRKTFLVSGYVVEGINQERQLERKEMLQSLDTFGQALSNDPLLTDIRSKRERAFELFLGDAVKVFDLETEKEMIREEYGRNWFGQSCLMARRLVQLGVPFITINYRGWDTHKRHFETLARRQAEWDRALAMLLKDLADHGLLDSTILWWGGEFGRTPKIGWDSPWFGGRGHHGQCFSVMLAGGGFQGGKIVGESDPLGQNVASRPVQPQDLLGSIYENLGIDPDGPLPNEKGIDVPCMPPASEAGRLHEIMS